VLTISIIVPAYNEENTVIDLLEAVSMQAFSDVLFEVSLTFCSKL